MLSGERGDVSAFETDQRGRDQVQMVVVAVVAVMVAAMVAAAIEGAGGGGSGHVDGGSTR